MFFGNPAKSIAVFILHLNRPDECLRTIKSFISQEVPLEITVIDNGSERKQIDQLEKYSPEGVQFIKLSENLGWGKAFNLGFAEWQKTGKADFICLSAHDSILHQGCLRRLRNGFQNNPKIGIVCPQYPVPCVPALSPLRGIFFQHPVPLGDGKTSLVSVPHGTLFLFRREVFRALNGFDEHFFAYGDETEISLRARKMGWQTALVWGAVVENPGSSTPRPLLGYLTVRNNLLMTQKHFGSIIAFVRALILVMNVFRLWCFPRKAWRGFSPRAQLHGIRDYYLGALGKPKLELFGL